MGNLLSTFFTTLELANGSPHLLYLSRRLRQSLPTSRDTIRHRPNGASLLLLQVNHNRILQLRLTSQTLTLSLLCDQRAYLNPDRARPVHLASSTQLPFYNSRFFALLLGSPRSATTLATAIVRPLWSILASDLCTILYLSVLLSFLPSFPLLFSTLYCLR